LGVLEDGTLLSASRKCRVAVHQKLLGRGCHDERCDDGQETHGGFMDGLDECVCWMAIYLRRETACQQREGHWQRKARLQGSHDWQKLRAGTKADRREKVRSGRYSSRDFAVAADKTMRLRNVP
jgi:hypothetical protein